MDYFWCPTVLHISAANNTEWSLPKGKYKFHFHNSAGLSYEIQECWDCISKGNIFYNPSSSKQTETYH